MTKLRSALLLGIIVSAGLLAALLARLDWIEFARAFHDVSPLWLGAAAMLTALSIAVRALRWTLISGLPSRQWAGVWYAEVVGYVGNLLYPGRVGEILRVAALHQLTRIPPGKAVASAFADRIADLVVLSGATILVVSHVAGLPGNLLGAAIVTGLTPLTLFIAVIAFGDVWVRVVGRMARKLRGQWTERLPRWCAQGVQSSRALRKPQVLVGVLLLSSVAAVCDYGIMWLVIRAMSWSLPVIAAVTVGILITLGSLLPAAPGYIGIYQVACMFALRPFGIGESAAIAYSVILQATVLIVFVLHGLAAFWRYGALLKQSE